MSRWPWVSRTALDAKATAYEGVRAILDQLRADHADQRREWADAQAAARQCLERKDAEIGRLTDQILTLRREGFSPAPPTAPDASPPLAPLPPEVHRAILKRAALGSPEAALLEAWAHQQREWGMDPDDIAKGILDGAFPDDA